MESFREDLRRPLGFIAQIQRHPSVEQPVDYTTRLMDGRSDNTDIGGLLLICWHFLIYQSRLTDHAIPETTALSSSGHPA